VRIEPEIEVEGDYNGAQCSEWEAAGVESRIDMDADVHSDFDSYAGEKPRHPAKRKQKQMDMPARRTPRLWIDILAALTLGVFDIFVRLAMWVLKR
jgi:anti-sigma factor RsiW